MLVISICGVEKFHGGIQSIEEVMQETFFEGKALQDIIEKKVPAPGKSETDDNTQLQLDAKPVTKVLYEKQSYHQ